MNLEALEIQFDVDDQIISIDENGYVLDGVKETSTDKEPPANKQTPLLPEEEFVDLDSIEDDEEEEKDESPEEIEKAEKVEEKDNNFPDNKTNKDTQETPEDVYNIFASELKEANILSDLSDEDIKKIKNTDDLMQAISSQFNIWADGYKSNLVNNLIQDGIIKPDQLSSNTSKVYSDEDIKSNVEIQKQIAKNYYKSKGIPEKKIDTLIEDTMDLEEDALEFNKELKSHFEEEQKQLAVSLKKKEEDNIKARETFNKTLKDNVFAIEEFAGRKVKNADKEIVLKNIPSTLTKINQNLAKYAPILAFLDHYKILEGNFEKVVTNAESNVVYKLSKALQEKRSGNSSGTKSNKFNPITSSEYNIYK
jgi:DNA-binding transcriptional MerR regulator